MDLIKVFNAIKLLARFLTDMTLLQYILFRVVCCTMIFLDTFKVFQNYTSFGNQLSISGISNARIMMNITQMPHSSVENCVMIFQPFKCKKIEQLSKWQTRN